MLPFDFASCIKAVYGNSFFFKNQIILFYKFRFSVKHVCACINFLFSTFSGTMKRILMAFNSIVAFLMLFFPRLSALMLQLFSFSHIPFHHSAFVVSVDSAYVDFRLFSIDRFYTTNNHSCPINSTFVAIDADISLCL